MKENEFLLTPSVLSQEKIRLAPSVCEAVNSRESCVKHSLRFCSESNSVSLEHSHVLWRIVCLGSLRYMIGFYDIRCEYH